MYFEEEPGRQTAAKLQSYDEGRRIAIVLRIVPETPEEVAELKKFCRLTDAFTFIIDEEYRLNQAHIAPVYGERTFAIASRNIYEETS